MRKQIGYSLVLFFGFLCVAAQVSAQAITGKVYDADGPLANVQVSVAESTAQIFTDEQGNYRIEAQPGDMLVFSHMGMKQIQIRVEDVTRFLNPVMVPNVNQLDEVIVQSSNRISARAMADRYFGERNTIQTAYGPIDGDRVAGNVMFLENEDILPVNLGLVNLLQNRFPGVSSGVLDNLANGVPVFLMRGASHSVPRPAIFDVDGQVFTNFPTWVDIANIERIAILNSLATTVKYGSLGSGGVIVINTFSGASSNGDSKKNTPQGTSFFTEDVLTAEQVRQNWPEYKKELYQSSSLDEAINRYEMLKRTYASSPYFFLDAQAYFANEMNQEGLANELIEEHADIFKNNAVLLKALAYQYQDQGQFKKAHEIFKDIFLLRPHYAQSYLDMANSYRTIGEPVQAASIHARYEHLLQEGFLEEDRSNFGQIMTREFNNLLLTDKDLLKEPVDQIVSTDDFKGTRIVFEWNDGEAEFELQFVSPIEQTHLWKHSLAGNADLISREKDKGFSVMEVLIDSELSGNWQINAKYLGNKSLTPTYLKASVYHNYNTPSQQKEIKVFKLHLKNANQKLFSVYNTNGLVSK